MTLTGALSTGAVVHQYRIASVLGSGTFGITYKAEHVTLSGRHAAIKEFFPAMWVIRDAGGIEVVANGAGAQAMEPGGGRSWFDWGRERFIGEARTLAAIEDEGVVQVLDFFPANGTAYFVMAYEEGEPFSARLSGSVRVPEPELRERLLQVLSALDAVHQKRYLHRDLKPDNLYLRRRDDRLMLIDFGAARQTLGERSQPLTSILTPGYAPIEQYNLNGEGDARQHGPWTDLYAVGAIAYQCVAGRVPVDAPARMLDDPLTAAVEVGVGRYSRELLELIDRALAVRPEDRFRSAASMREALSPARRTATTLLRRPNTWGHEENQPLWASVSGVDRFGRWCEFSVGNITQRMRWIVPGEFLMGAPETEEARRGNETLHSVTLTEGYWLADTACTQALWEAVTGENPSVFKGADRPVENVRWDDVQVFCTTLRERLLGLDARLPTEAEWEYAARAGTRTAFWWGNELTTDRANYDGNYPYPEGEENGEYREETMEAKAFEANPWGLYQVHGNVYEWCQDWHGAYVKGEQVNPTGPYAGGSRVVRGGSWFDDGRLLRAAFRGRDVPGHRGDYLGFRLTAGQSAGPEPR